jgi:hypothetical protein
MDGAGRFMRAEWIHASSDTAAVEAARVQMGDCAKCEVWLGTRFVERLLAPDWPDPRTLIS